MPASPAFFREQIRIRGPGFILPAYVAGSGELFAKTGLGAEAGWVTHLVIAMSYLVKVLE